MNPNQQLEFAKTSYESKKYEECLNFLYLAKNSGLAEAKRFFSYLLDTDDQFRDAVDQNYYLHRSLPNTLTNIDLSDGVSTGRLSRWQQKLLDLTFRNKFLNFRETKLSIPLLFHEVSLLEDHLASGKRFSIHPILEKFAGFNYEQIADLDGRHPVIRYMTDGFSKKHLFSPLTENELSRRLLELFRQTKHDLEECGVSTLFLALGILSWPGDERSGKTFRAPVLLLPMRLVRKSAQDFFSVEHSDEDIIVNITLLEKLSQDYGITVPDVGIDHLPEDSSGVDVRLIFDKFRQAIQGKIGWKLKEEVWLSSFSFEKFIMWNDLKNRTAELLTNPLVRHLVNNPGQPYQDAVTPILPDMVDHDFSYEQIYAPLSTDSSQLSAILSAARGKTFVLHGPPGTGKSQTITNIIAECLAIGKHVLFVAEKRAALEVVHHRLAQLGLKPFCLELHSNKTGKQEVLEQFREVINWTATNTPSEWHAISAELEEEKKNLNDYVKALHQEYPNGLTPYQAISYLIAHQDTSGPQLPPLTVDVALMPRDDFDKIKLTGKNIAVYLQEVPPDAWTELQYIECPTWTPGWGRSINSTALTLTTDIAALKTLCERLFSQLGFHFVSQSLCELDNVATLIKIFTRPLKIPQIFYGNDWRKFSSTLKDFIPLAQQQEKCIVNLKSSGVNILLQLARQGIKKRLTEGKGDIIAFDPERTLGYSAQVTVHSPQWAVDFFHAEEEYVKRVNRLITLAKSFFDTIGLSFEHISEVHLHHALELTKLIEEAPVLPKDFLSGDWQNFSVELHHLIEAGKARDCARKRLDGFNLKEILTLNISDARTSFEKNNSNCKLIKFFVSKFIVLRIQRYRAPAADRIAYTDIPAFLDIAERYQNNQKRLNSISPEHEQRLDKLWNQSNVQWDELEKILLWGEHLYSAVSFYLEKEKDRDTLCRSIGEILAGERDPSKNIFFDTVKNMPDAWHAYTCASDDFYEIFFRNIHGDSKETRGNSLFAEFSDGQTDSPIPHDHFLVNQFTEPLAAFVELHANVFSIATSNKLSERAEFWWHDGRGMWNKFQNAVDYIDEVEHAGQSILALEPGSLTDIRQHWGELLHNADRMLFLQSPLQNDFERYVALWKKVKSGLKIFREELCVNRSWNPENENDFLDRLSQFASVICRNETGLRYWCLWRTIREEALAQGLSPIVNAVESKQISWNLIPNLTELLLVQKFSDEVFAQVAPLRDFLGSKQEERIKNFQKTDAQYAELSRKIILAKLSERLPGARARRSQPVDGTPLGILQRELARQRGHKPLRKLFEEISGILFDLKPCFLMSPLSVAQFLPADHSLFDIVIFDEASQIPMEDAVGAIARGTQLIVAGDPKQLPPTVFFKRHEDDDADENAIVELESLLQECLADGFYESHLLWHYRSRDESLISFSNAHYYDNSLWTFPAPTVQMGAGVHFQFVEDGIYDRTCTGTNIQEAQTLVNAVVRQLREPSFEKKSLGIVTFSIRQQILIEDLLDEARRQHPEIERFFDPAQSEPVFVKNLENVQGDERDVIFFSICYAADENGKFYMNFGPLNIDKGERRLNVAITRAKEKIVVFSSIHAEDVDLSKTSKNGPRDLKSFLHFAETGILDGVPQRVCDDGYDAMFEREIVEFLTGRGFQVQSRIGYSAYKIDIAVISPKNPDRYVIGIECDGAFYKSSRSARDRDKLRQQILTDLGWRLCRVWSTTWWEDRTKAENRLLQEVEKAIQQEDLAIPPQFSYDASEDQPESEAIIQEEPPLEEKQPEVARPYPNSDYSEDPIFKRYINNQDQFYEFSTRSALLQQMLYVIKREGPVTENLLRKRIVQTWGFNRTGTKIQDVLSAVLPKQKGKKQSDGQLVFWPDGITAENYHFYRYPEKTENTRSIDNIPLVEIKNAMFWFLSQYHVFSDQDVLFRETGKLLGINRLTEQGRPYYKRALSLLQKEGVVS